ncbi:protein phosphatase 1 regulatory subunit 12B-like [Scleropages formosus]|uniref:Protein phosphatase 1 regulatory subunit 12B-like n=1 Tax=Scleropages formosus TaxID=113540 RepID=A0A8C9SEH5_SCLFO|nr:protein phosphatase 1 regulatory subunit 12B-like [Scleropages formosus]
MSSVHSRNKDQRKSWLDLTSSSNSATTSSFKDRSSRVVTGQGSRAGDRENRLASLKKLEDEAGFKNYIKRYENALAENEKLKSQLTSNKQELIKVQTELEKATQERIHKRLSVLETEKMEIQVLEKKISAMEKELKAVADLKSENQKLKDENSALIRVISKLSK